MTLESYFAKADFILEALGADEAYNALVKALGAFEGDEYLDFILQSYDIDFDGQEVE